MIQPKKNSWTPTPRFNSPLNEYRILLANGARPSPLTKYVFGKLYRAQRSSDPSPLTKYVREELAPLERQPHLRVRRRRAREQGGRRPAGSRAQRERADGDLQAGTRPRRSALSSTASDRFVRGLHV